MSKEDKIFFTDSWNSFQYATKTPHYKKIYEIDFLNKTIVENPIILEDRASFSLLHENTVYIGTTKGDVINTKGGDKLKACTNFFITAIVKTIEGEVVLKQ